MNLRHTFHHHPHHVFGARIASLINVVAGMYLFLSPWIFPENLNTAGAWNCVFFGVVVAILALDKMSLAYQVWLSWINAAIGLWVIISPWVLGFSSGVGITWTCVVTGAVILGLAVFSAIESPTSDI